MTDRFDAVLLISFGGPEGIDDVLPFLRNVTRGRNVPEARLNEVAHHYELFGGISPINSQNRELLQALKTELDRSGIDLPIFWGNRNWHPLLSDTMKSMTDQGVKRAVAFATSAYSSYSGCRQYLEDIDRARSDVGSGAPVVEKIKPFYNQTGYLEANSDRLKQALMKSSIRDPYVLFSAHSIPASMAKCCQYQHQLLEVAQALAYENNIGNWRLVFQSRSGPPAIPWLEPDINDCLRTLHESGVSHVVVAPIGFVSDHMEILYDLDTEAALLCEYLKIEMVRASTVGTHPAFVRMIRQLIEHQLTATNESLTASSHCVQDLCGPNCCPQSIGRLLEKSGDLN